MRRIGHDTKTAKDFLCGANFQCGVLLYFFYSRALPSDDVLSSIKETVALKRTFPDFLLGYDLVGQEDPGRPLMDDIKALLYPSQNNIDLKFFFHAGETGN